MTSSFANLRFTLRYFGINIIDVHQFFLLPLSFERFHICKETCPGQTAYADIHNAISLRDQNKINGLQNWPYANGNLEGKFLVNPLNLGFKNIYRGYDTLYVGQNLILTSSMHSETGFNSRRLMPKKKEHIAAGPYVTCSTKACNYPVII